MFSIGITGDWSTAALNPGAWYNTECVGDCRLSAAWVREEERAPESRKRGERRKRRAKVEVAPGVTVRNLRCFRAAFIGPTQRLSRRRRLRR